MVRQIAESTTGAHNVCASIYQFQRDSESSDDDEYFDARESHEEIPAIFVTDADGETRTLNATERKRQQEVEDIIQKELEERLAYEEATSGQPVESSTTNSSSTVRAKLASRIKNKWSGRSNYGEYLSPQNVPVDSRNKDQPRRASKRQRETETDPLPSGLKSLKKEESSFEKYATEVAHSHIYGSALPVMWEIRKNFEKLFSLIPVLDPYTITKQVATCLLEQISAGILGRRPSAHGESIYGFDPMSQPPTSPLWQFEQVPLTPFTPEMAAAFLRGESMERERNAEIRADQTAKSPFDSCNDFAFEDQCSTVSFL